MVEVWIGMLVISIRTNICSSVLKFSENTMYLYIIFCRLGIFFLSLCPELVIIIYYHTRLLFADKYCVNRHMSLTWQSSIISRFHVISVLVYGFMWPSIMGIRHPMSSYSSLAIITYISSNHKHWRRGDNALRSRIDNTNPFPTLIQHRFCQKLARILVCTSTSLLIHTPTLSKIRRIIRCQVTATLR